VATGRPPGTRLHGRHGVARRLIPRRPRADGLVGQTYSEWEHALDGKSPSREAGGGSGEGVPKGAAWSAGPGLDNLCETVKIAVPHVEEVSVIWQKRD